MRSERKKLRQVLMALGAFGILCLGVQNSRASTLLVGQCVEFAPCYSSEVAWSDTLTGTQLADLGLGATVPLIAAQTSQFVIRLGVTTMTFTTTGGPVTETLPEFSGTGRHSDPCDFCEIDTVGTFTIPTDATGATISGTFGNSVNPSSAGVNVCLNSGVPCAPSSAAEPASLSLLLLAVSLSGGLLALESWRRVHNNATT